MKQKNELKKYIKQRFFLIKKLLKKKEIKWNFEDFHKLRVELKKLFAVLNMLRYFKKTQNKKISKSVLGTIFHKAGTVREIQIRDKILKSYGLKNNKNSYRSLLNKEIQIQKKRFFSFINKKNLKKVDEIEKSYLSSIENYNLSNKQKYSLQLAEKIIQISHNDVISENMLHNLRKTIKEYFYINSIGVAKNNDLTHLDEFQELLGLWHDNEVIKDALTIAVSSNKLTSTEVGEIKTIKRRIASRNKSLLNKIYFFCSKGII